MADATGVRFSAAAFVCGFTANAATLPERLATRTAFNVPCARSRKLSLPIETLDATRPALEDLRVYDDAGNEVPYLIERPVPVSRAIQSAKSFQVSLNPSTTIITLETGLTQPLDGATLETPATSFIKSVKIEGSTDGRRWQSLAQGQPIFRQPNGVSQLHLTIPPGRVAMAAADVGRPTFRHRSHSPARAVHAAAGEPAPRADVRHHRRTL
jgi:hypothetical protein